MTKKKKVFSMLEIVRKYWPMLISALALISGYVMMGQKASAAFEAVTPLTQQVSDLKTEVAVLKEIAKSIPEIQKDVKELLKRR